MLPGETIGEILLNIVKIYLILSFLLTCYSVIRMYVIRHRATAVKYGKERIQQLIEQGRFRQLPLYTMDEISQKKSLGEVRLSIFPNDTGERRKYVIVCPGGGYAHCVTGQEGYWPGKGLLLLVQLPVVPVGAADRSAGSAPAAGHRPYPCGRRRT